MQLDARGLKEAEVQEAINNYAEEKKHGAAFRTQQLINSMAQIDKEIEAIEESQEKYVLTYIRDMDKEACKNVVNIIKERFPNI